MRAFDRILRPMLLVLYLAILPVEGRTQELVTGLSHETIYITSDFTGTDLVVFGTINNMQELPSPQGEDTTMDDYGIIVVIEGPAEPGVVRKKQRTAGIWVNRDSIGYATIPASYLMMTSQKPDNEGLQNTLKALKIGLEYTPFGKAESNTALNDPEDFRKAIVRLKMKNGLYRESNGVKFLGDNLFRAQFKIPALIPVGTHTVHSYLVVDGKPVSHSRHVIQITKTGFEQLMFDFSRQYGYLYGVFCVILAMVTGWMSSVIFRRG